MKDEGVSWKETTMKGYVLSNLVHLQRVQIRAADWSSRVPYLIWPVRHIVQGTVESRARPRRGSGAALGLHRV